MKVWKVTNDKNCSALTLPPFSVQYVPGEWVSGRAPLFVFTDLFRARLFAVPGNRVWSAEARGRLRTPPGFQIADLESDLEAFWKDPISYSRVYPKPPFTELVDEVRLETLEYVYYKDYYQREVSTRETEVFKVVFHDPGPVSLIVEKPWRVEYSTEQFVHGQYPVFVFQDRQEARRYAYDNGGATYRAIGRNVQKPLYPWVPIDFPLEEEVVSAYWRLEEVSDNVTFAPLPPGTLIADELLLKERIL